MLPQLTVTLLIPTFFFGALLAGAAAGYRREGLWLREGRMTLRRQQGLYLHCICVFHPDVCLTAAQSPWAASVGRTNLTLTFPGWVKLKVRSVPLRDAEKFSDLWKRIKSLSRRSATAPPIRGALGIKTTLLFLGEVKLL